MSEIEDPILLCKGKNPNELYECWLITSFPVTPKENYKRIYFNAYDNVEGIKQRLEQTDFMIYCSI